jgi:acetolactate synthase I/II/III large subunit
LYTASTAFLEALADAGVSCIFANFGSDHPGLIEALAQAKATGQPAPRLITCPNEMVALSAAQGFAQATGRPQAVVVHVDCGTQALAGAVHNAAKCRVPVLIFAGAAPHTQEGELRGSRNEFIHWIQDVPDQRGLVRGYVKYDNEIRTGRNVKQIVHRALQLAVSEPKGPAYLMATREVMEEEIPRTTVEPARWRPLSPQALAPEDVAAITADLLAARYPLVVTSYLGRNERAVTELLRLCRRLGIGVLESGPTYVNFPSDEPLYLGNQFSEPVQNPDLERADLVLVLDSDVPWIPLHNRPSAAARIIHIDTDPLKERTPLWYIAAERVCKADVGTALHQINVALEGAHIDAASVSERLEHYRHRHREWELSVMARELPAGDIVTAEYLTARIRERLGPDCVVLNEGITNYTVIHNHLRPSPQRTVFRSGGSSLGWNGGAAVGMKLACADKMVVCLTGDGSYLFSVPAAVHWMARQYATPFLQVIFNNRGWRSPKLSTLAVHPDGYASRSDDLGVNLDPPPDHAGIAAAAGGAFARTVRQVDELDEALEAALHAVRVEHRCAVLDVWLPHL